MSDWVNVMSAADLAEGARTEVEIDDVRMLVFNLDGEFYAIEDVCTHDGAEFGAAGCVHGHEIECPRHGAKFNIKTGEVTAPPAYEPVSTFPVEVVEGIIRVRDDRWD